MRDYASVVPQFWTGETGRALKEAGHETLIVALYLMTCPHSNMIGLYYLPTLYLAHETGLGEEGALKGLARASEAGFCSYDKASEHVFVHSMARFQVAESLKPGDNRVKGVINALSKAPKGPLVQAFIAAYNDAFNLEFDVPAEAPCKPLASQEQEQEQEQEQARGKTPSPRKPKKTKAPEITFAAWADSLGDDSAVAADDPIFAWANSTGINSDWIALAWWVFEARYSDNPKTYTDWRAVFRKAVREDWLKAWRHDARENRFVLTTVGEQARREMEAAP